MFLLYCIIASFIIHCDVFWLYYCTFCVLHYATRIGLGYVQLQVCHDKVELSSCCWISGFLPARQHILERLVLHWCERWCTMTQWMLFSCNEAWVTISTSDDENTMDNVRLSVPAQAWNSPPATRTAANEAPIFHQFSDDLFSRHPQNRPL